MYPHARPAQNIIDTSGFQFVRYHANAPPVQSAKRCWSAMMPVPARIIQMCLAAVIATWSANASLASPAHKAALIDRYGRLLPKASASCITCHTSDPGIHMPTKLSDIPHNAFGASLAALGSSDIETRLAKIAKEDTDHDGTSNELELLAGTNPANASERPTRAQLTDAALKQLPLAYRIKDSCLRRQPIQHRLTLF